MIGQVDKAMQSIHNYHQVWKQYGFTPEFYNIPKGEAQNGREGYPLRPGQTVIINSIAKSRSKEVLKSHGIYDSLFLEKCVKVNFLRYAFIFISNVGGANI